jgi:hypothetical protein
MFPNNVAFSQHRSGFQQFPARPNSIFEGSAAFQFQTGEFLGFGNPARMDRRELVSE